MTTTSMFITNEEYTAMAALGNDSANNVEGLKPLDYLKAKGMNLMVDDSQAFMERRQRDVRVVYIPIDAWRKLFSIYETTTNTVIQSLFFVLLGLSFGVPVEGSQFPVVLKPKYEKVLPPKFTKGTASQIYFSKVKPSTDILVEAIEPNTTTVAATSTVASDASGNAAVSITIPATYAKNKVKLRSTQILKTAAEMQTILNDTNAEKIEVVEEGLIAVV